MAPPTTSTPVRIGRYELVRELGSGAMGTVYVAHDTILGRSVALKTFRSGIGATPADLARLRRRLLREAQIAGLVTHPNVVTVYDVVDEGERGFYIAMELVDGTSLQERLETEGPLNPEQALELTWQIASALDHLHQREIVHRDLKPANILLTPGGLAKLTDFGIARPDEPSETQETAVFGTPQYMAPEQIQGLPTDSRTDVFALGVLLYEMLLGSKPFRGTTVAEVTHSILYEAPVPADSVGTPLPAPVARVLERALAKAPEDRFGSAGELAAALRSAGTGGRDQWELDTAATAALPQPSRRPGDLVARFARSSPRRWLPLTLSLILAAVGVGALALTWTQNQRTTEALAEAPEMELAYLRLLAEGRRLMTNEDYRGAAVLFTAAQGFRRDSLEAQRLRLEAVRLAQEQGVRLEVEEARQALAEGRYEQVISVARSLLTTEAGHREALQVLSDVESALKRPATAPEPRPAPARPARAPAPPLEPSHALLEVELEALAPTGVIALYADSQRVLWEPYDFYQRRAWLWKNRHPGHLSRAVEIPPETTTLRLLVARRGEPARMLTHETTFGPGGSRRLEVTVPVEGEPASELF